jgi:ATP-dependent Clp protease ATP-binding subunit ClpA
VSGEQDPIGDVLDQLSTESKMVLFSTRGAVSRFGGKSVEAPHLLLGVVGAVPGVITRFAGEGWPVDRIRERAVGLFAAGEERMPLGANVPLSEDCQRALERSAEEASASNSSDVRPEHLVLALLDDPRVGPLLKEVGLSRELLLAVLEQP